jgi:hypothetical protein
LTQESESSDDEPARVWLPKLLSSLSGIPEARRRKRVLVIMQAFVDESGGKGQGPVFVFSGLVGEAEKWAELVDSWDAVLKAPPSIRYFKMSEAATKGNEFRGFSDIERDEKVKNLCKVINTPHLAELFIGWNLSDFERDWAPRLGRPACEPYFFPFQMIHFMTAYELLSHGLTQPFEMFFDQHVIFGPPAKAWYPIIKAVAPAEIRAILPVEPFFRSDLDVLPLQAADLTAWINNKNSGEGLGEFTWLPDHLQMLNRSTFSKMLGAEWIKSMLAYKFSPEEIEQQNVLKEIYRDTFGHEWPPKDKLERKKHRGK